jgi:lipocalin
MPRSIVVPGCLSIEGSRGVDPPNEPRQGSEAKTKGEGRGRVRSGFGKSSPAQARACHPVGARDALRNRQPLVRPADAFFVRPADRVHMATGVLAALAALAAVATGEGPDTGAALAAGASSCRPVRTMAPFAVDEFVAHRWFVQAQQPIIYLPKAEIYCVTAEYNKTSATSVDVHNYANSGRVNGKVSDSGGTLQAIIPNAEFPSKLEVGPKFLPHLLYGPYWVIAAGGSSASGYDWAVIAGGQPTVRQRRRCEQLRPLDLLKGPEHGRQRADAPHRGVRSWQRIRSVGAAPGEPDRLSVQAQVAGAAAAR